MVFGGETAESYYDEGVTASMRGDYATAVQHFQRALELDPHYVACYHQLGKCKVRLGDVRQAVECFYRVIQARPGPLPPRLDLGFALLEAGDPERAAETFDGVLAVKPDHAKALLGLGACAFNQGNWKRALALATEAVNLGGATFAALYLQARAARLAGRPDLAKAAFEQADALVEKSIESNPELPENYFLRGEVYFAQENFAAALEALQAAEARMRPEAHYYSYGEHFDLVTVLEKRGMCLLRLDRLSDAREIGQDIKKMKPESRIAALLTDSDGSTPTA